MQTASRGLPRALEAVGPEARGSRGRLSVWLSELLSGLVVALG